MINTMHTPLHIFEYEHTAHHVRDLYNKQKYIRYDI